MSEPTFLLDPDLYGRCKRDYCLCLRPENPWIGRGCPNWEPISQKMTVQDFSKWVNEVEKRERD